jgi:hypothetical protein
MPRTKNKQTIFTTLEKKGKKRVHSEEITKGRERGD